MLQNDYLKHLWSKTKKCTGWLFAAVAVGFSFVSLDELLTPLGWNYIWVKILFLAGVCLLGLLVALLLIRVRKDKPVTLYDKEGARLQVEFGDITSLMRDNTNGERYTVVFSVNDHADNLLDDSFIKKSSVHGQWLSFLRSLSPDEYKSVTDQIVNQTASKKLNIGDCILVNNVRNVNYILSVTCKLHGCTPVCSEEFYLKSVQSLISFMKDKCDVWEKVYLPVIGAGNATISGKSHQKLLRMLTEIILFNSEMLNYQAHIVVYDDKEGKMRKDIRLFALRPHN